jgi:hypothetical protein
LSSSSASRQLYELQQQQQQQQYQHYQQHQQHQQRQSTQYHYAQPRLCKKSLNFWEITASTSLAATATPPKGGKRREAGAGGTGKEQGASERNEAKVEDSVYQKH